jgi:hypothetical protein
VAALGQHWKHEQLEADGTGEDFLIDQGAESIRIKAGKTTAGGFTDEFMLGELDERGGAEGQQRVLRFAGGSWLPSVFSHLK